MTRDIPLNAFPIMKNGSLSLLSSLAIILCVETLSAKEEYRYEVLVAGAPSGEVVDTWEEATVGGQCVVKSESAMRIVLSRGGFDLAMSTRTVAEADCGTYRPRSLSVTRDEGGGPIVTTVRREGDLLVSKTEKNGVSEKGTLKLDGTSVFFGMLFRKYPVEYFLKKGEVPAISEEGLTVRNLSFVGRRAGKDVVIDMEYAGVPITVTVRDRVVVHSIMNGGLIVYRLRGAGDLPMVAGKGLSNDVLAATALPNEGLTVKNPRRLARLVMSVEKMGPDPEEACGQRSEKKGDSRVIRVERPEKPCAGEVLPVDTAATIYEDKDAPIIQKTVARWRSISERSVLVRKVVSFVYGHITDKNYRHGTLSASETLEKRSGDCTEHAVLAAALLKALGVPTRMAYGLVLSDDGRFFFHNWILVHTGTGWTNADPTYDQFPADAARLFMTSGGAGTAEREDLSLSILNILRGARFTVTGFSHE
ncbi:MAG TPA: transglutaminase-like domain-containing protein [bacterium]|nr:transglutaminase-like domain-containing protein [bacterium]